MTARERITAGEERDGTPLRRCIATGSSSERGGLIRFVVGPTGDVLPDLQEKLPGRGMWVSADRAAIETARRRKLFARAAQAPVGVPADLADRTEALMARRCVDLLGLALRAGLAVVGSDRVRERLLQGRRGLLVQAADGSAPEKQKLQALATGMPVNEVLTASELGSANHRERVVHALIERSKLADQFAREAARLAGLRRPGTETAARPEPGAQAQSA